jgi:trk system potassium uptake protein TrkA
MTNKKFCVIGCGYFGYNLAVNLYKAGAEVLAIDQNEDIIEKLSEQVTHVIAMDSTDRRAMKKLGLTDMDAVIVAIGEGFESSLLTTAVLQEIGVKNIYNRVTSAVHERLIKLMGVTELFVPESEAAEHLASRLMIENLIEVFKITESYAIFEIKAPAIFVNKTLLDINLRQNYSLNLVTIKRIVEKTKFLKDETTSKFQVIGVPKPDTLILENDILVLSGFMKDLMKITENED